MRIDMYNKQGKQYIKMIERQLLCPRKAKESMLLNLKNSVLEYTEENPDVTLDEMKSRFGEPKAIADDYIASLDQEDLRKAIKKSDFLKRAIIISVAIVVLAVVITSVIVVIHNNANSTKYIYDSIDDLNN